jgi:hypothetical protein
MVIMGSNTGFGTMIGGMGIGVRVVDFTHEAGGILLSWVRVHILQSGRRSSA